MADRYTSCTAPGVTGFAVQGRATHAEAVAAYRQHYEHQLAEAQRALAIPDDELVVETFLGLYAMRNRQSITKEARRG